MEKVRLTISGLTADVEMGLSRKEISAKYGLAPTQLKKAMDRAGLKGVRAKVDKFELIDDITYQHNIQDTDFVELVRGDAFDGGTPPIE